MWLDERLVDVIVCENFVVVVNVWDELCVL